MILVNRGNKWMMVATGIGILFLIFLIHMTALKHKPRKLPIFCSILFVVVLSLSACGTPAATKPTQSGVGSQASVQTGQKTQSSKSLNQQSSNKSGTNGAGGLSAKQAQSSETANSAMNSSASTSSSSSSKTTIPSVKNSSGANTKNNLIAVVVSKNVDGDTIHVTMPNGKDEDIRMLLIDTPEDVSPTKPVEPFGIAATNYAKQVLPVGKHIYIEEGASGYKRDKYGRLLAYVYLTPTDMYNVDVVKKGLARVAYIYPPNTKYLSELKAAQSEAKAQQLGIWSLPNYVTPNGYSLQVACPYAQSKGYSTKGCPASTLTLPSTSSSNSSSPTGGSVGSNGIPSSAGTAVTNDQLNVRDGGEASITVHTPSSALATIEVDYKSGPSHAKGLQPERANSSGQITWSWKVGTNTTPGNYPVIIMVGSQTITKYLQVSK